MVSNQIESHLSRRCLHSARINRKYGWNICPSTVHQCWWRNLVLNVFFSICIRTDRNEMECEDIAKKSPLIFLFFLPQRQITLYFWRSFTFTFFEEKFNNVRLRSLAEHFRPMTNGQRARMSRSDGCDHELITRRLFGLPHRRPDEHVSQATQCLRRSSRR